MIYYFSGSGNSYAIARTLQSLLNQWSNKVGSYHLSNDDVQGFVLPVYSWGIAPFVLEWISRVKLPEKKPQYIWAVIDYGDEAGYAHHMLRKALAKRGLKLDAVFGIQMPNTYVLLPGFNVDPEALAAAKLEAAKPRILKIAQRIKRREPDVEDIHIGTIPGLKSGLVYSLFKTIGIFPKRWHYDADKCIGCGLCENACPVGNVSIVDRHSVYSGNGANNGLALKGGHPEWDNDCTSCLACYHACPTHAVRYGYATRRKGQWRHWFQHPNEKLS